MSEYCYSYSLFCIFKMHKYELFTLIIRNKNKQGNVSLSHLTQNVRRRKISIEGMKLRHTWKNWLLCPGISSINDGPSQPGQQWFIDRWSEMEAGRIRARVALLQSFISPHRSTKPHVHAETLPYKIADLQAKAWWILCQGILIRGLWLRQMEAYDRNQTTSHLWKHLLKLPLPQ